MIRQPPKRMQAALNFAGGLVDAAFLSTRRWHHNQPGRPTVLCLHGFMLGEPKQAERMFRVRQLFELGLDVALFVTPFHWRRAPKGWRSRGMFLQPKDVCMTAEAIGHTMYDLYAAFQILECLGAGRIGLVGASMGGYHAALFSCLSARPAFCAMMVPAVRFKSPLESRFFQWFSGLPPQVLDHARRVERFYKEHARW
ncbi:MAG: alpha/beta hydrolase family protein [Desulfatitalea sp.]|nr:alpha/beta hydrolase family protein [Desulfatitalea sp.]MBI5896340.1 alpha/beta hydrolase family protein [Desulfobacterales bacterium]